MRTKRQLLFILLKNINKIGLDKSEIKGLCILNIHLERQRILSGFESDILADIISDNATKRSFYTSLLYYFEPGKRFPRRLYLIRLIIKYTFIK